MSKIGVPINTSKSVLANNPVTEFAKVTSYYGHNVSPVSWKMFMSQNHLMGRANIAFSMLSRGIISHRVNPWIENIARRNRTNPGNSTPTFIALLSMLASNGKIPLELVLKCLINGKVLAFSFYKSILLNADVLRIKQIVPALFRGDEIKLTPNKRVEAIFGYEKPWFGITLWKPLAVFSAKLDPDGDALTLTRAIFNACLGYDEPGDNRRIDFSAMGLEFDFGSLYENGAPSLNGELPDVQQNDLISLFSIFYASAKEKLEGLSEGIRTNVPDIQDDIPKLVDQNAEKDRYLEFTKLTERAHTKIFSGVAPSKSLVDSPLKSITFLRRMSVRPNFTKLQSFD
nr:MAG: RNA-dependent RNA polymerase [Phaeoacremonium minimum mitovirus 1]